MPRSCYPPLPRIWPRRLPGSTLRPAATSPRRSHPAKSTRGRQPPAGGGGPRSGRGWPRTRRRPDPCPLRRPTCGCSERPEAGSPQRAPGSPRPASPPLPPAGACCAWPGCPSRPCSRRSLGSAPPPPAGSCPPPPSGSGQPQRGPRCGSHCRPTWTWSRSLEAAADVGHGPAFALIRARLTLAARTGGNPYAALAALADEVDVPDLRDLADITATAADGAAIYTTLLAKSRSLRNAIAADAHAAANAASERLVFPVVLLGTGFLLLLFYPALARLTGAG